ncbi:MAG: CBU_0592 family membrane protein [Paracoccaceae bacterium]
MTYFPFDLTATELLGILGFCTYVSNYTMLTLRVISADCLPYFFINLCAAGLVLIGLSGSFNLASALIQGFWIVISLIGIAVRLRRRRGFRDANRAVLPLRTAA